MIPVLLSLSLIRKYYFKKNKDDVVDTDCKSESVLKDEISEVQDNSDTDKSEDNLSETDEKPLLKEKTDKKKSKKKPKKE